MNMINPLRYEFPEWDNEIIRTFGEKVREVKEIRIVVGRGDESAAIENLKHVFSKCGFDVEERKLALPGLVELSPHCAILIVESPELADHLLGMRKDELKHQFYNAYEHTAALLMLGAKRPSGALSRLSLRWLFEFGKGFTPIFEAEHILLVIRSLLTRIYVRDKDPVPTRPHSKFKTIFDAQLFLLQGLLDCGPRRAEALAEAFTSPYEVIRFIVNSNPKNTSEVKLKTMRFPDKSDGKILADLKIGRAFIEKNRRILQA